VITVNATQAQIKVDLRMGILANTLHQAIQDWSSAHNIKKKYFFTSRLNSTDIGIDGGIVGLSVAWMPLQTEAGLVSQSLKRRMPEPSINW
jgi:hypothetical protein